MEIRSFLALKLPPEIKKTLSHILREMKKTPLDVRWVKAGNIHITLVFLGNVPVGYVEPIGEAAEKVCQQYGPFAISLRGAGVFSSRRNPRVLWAGMEGDIDRMTCFRDVLQRHLKPFGIKQEKRPFRPHLTIGRFRKGARPGNPLDDLLTKYQDLTSPVCALKELILFKSDLKPDGPVYSELKGWPLIGDF
jgi:2'-5' RNA ligase